MKVFVQLLKGHLLLKKTANCTANSLGGLFVESKEEANTKLAAEKKKDEKSPQSLIRLYSVGDLQYVKPSPTLDTVNPQLYVQWLQ